MSDGTGKRVIVVDDEPLVHEVVGTLLKSRGYDVLSVMSGRECLQKIYEWVPALLILDFQMPGLEGNEVFETLRSKGLLADIPVIFLSSLSLGQQVEKVPISRNVRFLRKPIEPEALLALVAEMIGR